MATEQRILPYSTTHGKTTRLYLIVLVELTVLFGVLFEHH